MGFRSAAPNLDDDPDINDIQKLRRLSAVETCEAYTVHKQHDGSLKDWLQWYTSWAVPGLGMFCEAYIIFSLGLTKPLQRAMFPTCFKTHIDCPDELTQVQNYIQIIGIIVGMLLFGALGDVIGRRWGSRMVATIMLSGTLMLTFVPLVSTPATYLHFYIFAATWYGFGVGGEYPMASATAAESSQADESTRNKRGQQVVLTFSGQGMGSLVNGCVILICMAMLGLTGSKLDSRTSRNVLMMQFAVGAAVSLAMVLWRYSKLKESKVWQTEKQDFEDLADAEAHPSSPAAPHITHTAAAKILRRNALQHFWPRLVATCVAWLSNDFAFYGNKLFQNTFITLLYPTATPFQRMQWSVLNSAVSLCGYFAAAAFVDKPWYGRRRMQVVGFLALVLLFGTCGVAFPTLTASSRGLMTFQALYFLSSFFNQFGPNCTTWLVAAEVFPTDVRTTFQGVSAASGKVGAICADILFSYVDKRTTFMLSALFGLLGAAVTWLFLPDTTGMSLDELDRMAKYMVANEFQHYHGEAVNPKHLSTWERWILKWHRHYDSTLDRRHSFVQRKNSQRWRSRHPSQCGTSSTDDVDPLLLAGDTTAHSAQQAQQPFQVARRVEVQLAAAAAALEGKAPRGSDAS